jgi:CHAD domain-containing protein
MDASSFLAEMGKERAARFRVELKRASGDPADEEAVHDLRVSIRRLQAWIAPWERIIGPDPGLKKAKGSLKRLMSPLGKLRDAHVKRDSIRTHLPAGDTPSYLYAVLVASEVQRRERESRRHLRNLRPGKIRIDIPRPPRSRETAADAGWEPSRLLAGSARDVMKLRKAALDPSNPEGLHRLRLAFKGYRYSRELFLPLFPEGNDPAAKPLHAFQTLLGTIHDCDVILEEAHIFMVKVLSHRGGSSVKTVFGDLRKRKFEEFRRIAGTEQGLARLLRVETRAANRESVVSVLPLPAQVIN